MQGDRYRNFSDLFFIQVLLKCVFIVHVRTLDNSVVSLGTACTQRFRQLTLYSNASNRMRDVAGLGVVWVFVFFLFFIFLVGSVFWPFFVDFLNCCFVLFGFL